MILLECHESLASLKSYVQQYVLINHLSNSQQKYVQYEYTQKLSPQ